jgi:hypothetical protein
MEIVDPAPDVDIDPAEYVRLLGYPRGHVLEGRALELAERAAVGVRAARFRAAGRRAGGPDRRGGLHGSADAGEPRTRGR